MGFLNHFRSVEKIGSKYLNSFDHFVILLINKILRIFMVDARIKDFGDFKFFFAINLDWR